MPLGAQWRASLDDCDLPNLRVTFYIPLSAAAPGRIDHFASELNSRSPCELRHLADRAVQCNVESFRGLPGAEVLQSLASELNSRSPSELRHLADRAVQCNVESFRGLPGAEVLQSICERGNVPQGERGPVPVAGGPRPMVAVGISEWRDDMSGASQMWGESSATQASGIGAASAGGICFVVSAVFPVSAPKTGPTLAFDKENTEYLETSVPSLSVPRSGEVRGHDYSSKDRMDPNVPPCQSVRGQPKEDRSQLWQWSRCLPRDGKVGASLQAAGESAVHCPVGAELSSMKACETGTICAALLWLPLRVGSSSPGAPVQKSEAEAEPESAVSAKSEEVFTSDQLKVITIMLKLILNTALNVREIPAVVPAHTACQHTPRSTQAVKLALVSGNQYHLSLC